MISNTLDSTDYEKTTADTININEILIFIKKVFKREKKQFK